MMRFNFRNLHAEVVQCIPPSDETGCFPYFLFLLYFVAETALLLTNVFLSIERCIIFLSTIIVLLSDSSIATQIQK